MRMRWWTVALAMGAAALALAAATLGLALEASPRVAGTPPPDAESARHLRDWVRQHDPRRVREGRVVLLRATAADLQLLAGQAAQLAGGAARVQLAPGRLDLALSLPLQGRWVNLEARLADGPDRPRLLRLRVGALVLPEALAEPALALALRWWDRPRDGRPPLHHMLQGTRWQAEQALLVYRWRADLPQRVAGWVLPPAQVERLRAYHGALVAWLATQRGTLEATTLLPPLFELARERSVGGDAAAENRAALLVLAAYATGRSPGALLPAARGWPAAPRRALVMAGRTDFPLHFLLSAALAAEGSGPLSDALGLVKEVSDARQGSGFSFTDIAVNRAGTRLGELAVRDPRRVQAALATRTGTDSLLPDVHDLPEFMPEREFLERFGGLDAPAYRAQLADIEARIAALPLFH